MRSFSFSLTGDDRDKKIRSLAAALQAVRERIEACRAGGVSEAGLTPWEAVYKDLAELHARLSAGKDTPDDCG